MGIETAIAIGLLAAGTGAEMYNTNKTAKKQDRALAQDIRNQGNKRREGEAKTNAEIERLKASTSADEMAAKLEAYTDAIRKKSSESTRGFEGVVGSDTFKQDAAKAAEGVMQYGNDQAGLQSRIDAPIDQRFNEGVSFGNLGVDMETIAREAQGRHYLDQLRLQGIKRNPWIDAGASLLKGAAGSVAGMGAAGASGGTGFSLGDFTGAMSNSGASGFGFGGFAKAGRPVGLPKY